MPGLPHPLLEDDVDVSKSVGRSRLPIWFANAAELEAYDMTTANVVMVGDWLYRKDTSLVGASGIDVLLDGNGNRWRRVEGEVFILPWSISAGIGANEFIIGHEFVTAVSFPENFEGSRARALSTAVSDRALPVKKNGTTFGEVIYAAVTEVATFESDPTSFAPGDYLTFFGPPGLDAGLANFFGTFLGSR